MSKPDEVSQSVPAALRPGEYPVSRVQRGRHDVSLPQVARAALPVVPHPKTVKFVFKITVTFVKYLKRKNLKGKNQIN